MPKSKPIRKPRRKISIPKNCYYCSEKKEPSFWDFGMLSKFVTDRNKIIPRSRNGLCARHQKKVGLNIKRARFLALMPYVTR